MAALSPEMIWGRKRKDHIAERTLADLMHQNWARDITNVNIQSKDFGRQSPQCALCGLRWVTSGRGKALGERL